MQEKINNILNMYEMCFEGLDCSPLNLNEFVLYFNIVDNELKNSLIFMDRKIYRQRQVLRELCKVYPDSKENFLELWERLHKVHKEIFKVLQEDFNISECWIDRTKDDIEYLRKP